MIAKTYTVTVAPDAQVSCKITWPGAVPGEIHSADLAEVAQACFHRFANCFGIGPTPAAKQLADCILHDFLFTTWDGSPLIVEEFRRDFLNQIDANVIQIDGLIIARWLSERGFSEDRWRGAPAPDQPAADQPANPISGSEG